MINMIKRGLLFKKEKHKIPLFILVFFYLNPAFSFPEMIRHGYNNCTVCHFSPTGGGILTEYGRELSREILSHISKENEEKFLYNLIRPPQWLNLGGDIRALQLYRDTPSVREAKFILMQADLEAALTYKKFSVAGTVGRKKAVKASSFTDHFISRRHFLLFQATDEFGIRGGRFFPAFGLNIADHTVVTRRGLGWDQGDETYNIEGAWLGETFNAYLTAILGKPNAGKSGDEHGAAASLAAFFNDRFKTGISYLYSENKTEQRNLLGPFGILGITPRIFLLTETDLQQKKRKGPKESRDEFGFVNYQRFNVEFLQGFHLFLSHEISKPDFDTSRSFIRNYGIGFQCFPRPHWEFLIQWQKEKNRSVSETYTDLITLLIHFYL